MNVGMAGREVVPGLEVLLGERRDLVAGRRVALLANHSSLSRDLLSGVDLLHACPDVDLVALFGPEHGLRGAAQAGEAVATATDARTGLPVFSLYGETRAPTPAMLSGIDLLLVDIQDCGARYFTYPSTVLLTQRAAAAAGVGLVILDRPNPLGGLVVQGNVLDPAFVSFVGAYPVATRHGLTLGELALLAAAEEGLPRPTVVAMEGWTRDLWYDATGLSWVPPSPNLPSLAAVALYPGTCLLEGTNVSEGRGTTQPFECCGAPWIDGERLRALLAARLPPAVRPRACTFVPAFSKHAGTLCQGVALHVRDRQALDAVAAGVQLLFALRDLYPDRFAVTPARAAGNRPFLDLLAGGDALRRALDRDGEAPSALLGRWSTEAATFAARRRPYLLYP